MKSSRMFCLLGAATALLLVAVSQVPSASPEVTIATPPPTDRPQVHQRAVADGITSIRRTLEHQLDLLSVGAAAVSATTSMPGAKSASGRQRSPHLPLDGLPSQVPPLRAAYIHSFGERLLGDDVSCSEDVARSGVFECVERFGRACVALSSCPEVVLVNRSNPLQTSVPGSVASAGLPLPQGSILGRAVRNALGASRSVSATAAVAPSSASPGTSDSESLAIVWHCEFRDAFHLWNGSLHRMVRYCNGPVARVEVPIRLRDVVAAQCVDLFAVLATADERIGTVASDRNASFLPEDPAANLSTRFPRGSVVAEEVAVTVREFGAFLPRAPVLVAQEVHGNDDSRTVSALSEALRHSPGGHLSVEDFRIRRGAEQAALRLCSSENIHLSMEARGWFHLWSLSDEWAARELSRLSKAGPSMRHQHRALQREVEAPGGHRGCQKEEYAPVRVLGVGDTASRFLVQRVVRWASSVCTNCRSSSFRFVEEYRTMSLASISTTSDDAFEFRQTMEFRESLRLQPQVVVVSLGQRDALAISLLNRTLLEMRLAAMISRYASMESKPEVLVVTPWQIFDARTEPHKRKMRVTALEYGPTARRLAEEVAPAIRRVVSSMRAGGGMERVHLVDVHATHLTWLERAFHGRILAEKENLALQEPLKSSEAALHGLHYGARSANYFLMQQLPDGHSPRKLTQKVLSMTVLMALLRRE